MYFNRFDICEAYWLYATLYNEGQTSYEFNLLSRLKRIKFNPRLYLSKKEDLEENARMIFDNLISNRGMRFDSL